MRILAIETSCDETAIAVVEAAGTTEHATFRILGNALLSQVELHRPYGGVFPSLAKREHIRNLPILLEAATRDAGYSDVDVIAVTTGPGLEPALWTGITFAKELAAKRGTPLVAVNHMEGHILAALAKQLADGSLQLAEVRMPVLALLISGGHTELVLMKDWLSYELIGQTRDDAVGEAFDKVARMLELPYPGGPEISRLAESVRTSDVQTSKPGHPMSDFRLPRPMLHEPSCDFSFSGLKTAVLYLLKERGDLTQHEKEDLALEFENAVVDVLYAKTARALEKTGAQTLVIGGGVSSNQHIRRIFTEKMHAEFPTINLQLPMRELTTDNAVMIALAGYYRALKKDFADPATLLAEGNLRLT